MTLRKSYSRWIVMALCATLLVQLASCGTLLYPERRGQSRGKIDPAVAILDGVGLLFFIIPGAIAFAVDFSTGAIYLPPSESSKATGDDAAGVEKPDNKVVYLNPDALSVKAIEETVARETGKKIDLNAPNVEIARFATRSMVFDEMAKANAEFASGSVMAHATP